MAPRKRYFLFRDAAEALKQLNKEVFFIQKKTKVSYNRAGRTIGSIRSCCCWYSWSV
jgi:hypothetical protein